MGRALPFIFAATLDWAGSITGVMVDPVAAVIARAKVVAMSGNHRAETVSDTYGHFVLKDLKPGTYSIEISSPGFKVKTINPINVYEDDVVLPSIEPALGVAPECGPFPPADVFTPIASGRSQLAGRVFLDGNTRAAGAVVALYGTKGTRSLASVRTDAKGDFLIPELRPGLYQLRIRLRGYAELIVDAVEIKSGFRSDTEPFNLRRCPEGVSCPNVKWTSTALCL
jgi:hypothetical protein